MVEVTYQMVLSTLQTVGILVGIFYYIMTLRNQQKNQEHSEMTRKIQLLISANQSIIEAGVGTDYSEIMDVKWDNYDDFDSKYGLESNPDYFRKRRRMWRIMNVTGLLVRDGLIDVRSYVQYVNRGPLFMWRKFKDIIEETRRRNDYPDYFIGLEHLAGEIEKYQSSQELKPVRDS
jgi:hypothetical protein